MAAPTAVFDIAAGPPEVSGPPSDSAISVRQLLTYLCLGTSAADGLTRSLAVLAPGEPDAELPLADLHAVLLQLGARPTPQPCEGGGKPWAPALGDLYRELGMDG